MTPAIEWLLTVLGTAIALAVPFAVPAIRQAVGKYIASLVQHRFDTKIEELKSELRRNEEQFAAQLRAKEQELQSLTDTTLSLRSRRHEALDARRLQAVEKLWASKIAIDRMRTVASMVSLLKWEEVLKEVESGDPSIKEFAAVVDKLGGIDFQTEGQEISAQSEHPFLPPDVWVPFSAYQRIMLDSAVRIKAVAMGTTSLLKSEDTLQPLMLLALPEYKDYIKEHGFSGYYYLLEVLEQKLLNAITEMLDGKAMDDATLKRTAEIISAARETDISSMPEIPEELKREEVPEPPKKQ